MTRPRRATKHDAEPDRRSPTGGNTRSTCRWRIDPGRRYAYCSANINLVGAALTAATRTWLPEFFERTVARPLQFGRWHWNLMPNGEGYLGGGAFLRPRDLLKVGQAYLDGGVWNGRRIVDRGLGGGVDPPRIADHPGTTGYSAEEFGNYYGEGADGLAWHLGRLDVGGRNVPTYCGHRQWRPGAARRPRLRAGGRCSPAAITARAESGAAGASSSSATASSRRSGR